MRIEATLEEWRALYDIAIKLKELKPWEKLWDLDLITLQLTDRKEPTICSVMGRGGQCYGIVAYDGLDAINNFFEMLNNDDMPFNQQMRYQNNFTCNYGSREELTTKERNIIKELGLKFRGNNNWIYFRVFEEGYEPYMPNKDEVINFTKILNQLYYAIESLNNGLKVDFENGKTLMHRFDKKSKRWIGSEEDMNIPEVEYPIAVLTNELLIQRLKNQKQTDAVLELDIVYLNSSIRDKDYDKPLITRMCLLIDYNMGIVLAQHMVTPKEEKAGIMFDIIIDYILQKGRPKTIAVRDSYSIRTLFDLCEKIDVELAISPQLFALDEFLQKFNKSFGRY